MKRRIFMQNVGWLGIFPSLVTAVNSNLIFGPTNTITIAGLFPVAVIYDAFNLTFACQGLHAQTYRLLTQNMSLRLPGNQGWMANFVLPADADLQEAVDRFAPEKDPKSLNKLAILFGAIGHTALHQELWPLYLKHDADHEEMVAYHDACCLREMAGLTTTDSSSLKEFEHLLLAMGPRSLERIHTLIADVDDGTGWLHKMVAWRNNYREKVSEYAKIMIASDEGKWKKYISDPKLYDADDPILKLADRYRRAESVKDVDVKNALNINGQSIYGRSLSRAVRGMLDLDEIISGKLK